MPVVNSAESRTRGRCYQRGVGNRGRSGRVTISTTVASHLFRPQQNCHPDWSEAKWRDLLYLLRPSGLWMSLGSCLGFDRLVVSAREQPLSISNKYNLVAALHNILSCLHSSSSCYREVVKGLHPRPVRPSALQR